RTARQAELYRQARSTLSAVEDAVDLADTVHRDQRLLRAVGLFLQAADADRESDEHRSERFMRLMPVPPWEWVPRVVIRTVRSGLYLVAISQAVSGMPSTLYLFDGPRHVLVDSGTGGTVQVRRV